MLLYFTLGETDTQGELLKKLDICRKKEVAFVDKLTSLLPGSLDHLFSTVTSLHQHS